MGKLSLYKSRQYYKRKNKKYTPGRPFKKQRRFPQKNKDIDTTLSYSDNFENESTSGIMSHNNNNNNKRLFFLITILMCFRFFMSFLIL